jgi:hypothetical protein
MNQEAFLYVITPIILFLVVYLLIITVTWPLIRQRTFIPVLWLLLIIIIFPPAFLILLLWFFIIHIGFLTSPYYVYDTPPITPIHLVPVSRIRSQSDRRINIQNKV